MKKYLLLAASLFFYNSVSPMFNSCNMTSSMWKNTKISTVIEKCNLTETTFEECDMRGAKLIDNIYNKTRFINCIVDFTILQILQNITDKTEKISVEIGTDPLRNVPIARITLTTK